MSIDWGSIITAEAQLEQALIDAKTAARARLAAHVSAARAGLITTLPGQQMIYLAKEAEAARWIGAEDPDLDDYPLISAEIGITAPDADQLAQLWLNMGSLWRTTAAGLEALRLTISAGIEAAATVGEVEAAVNTTQKAALPAFSATAAWMVSREGFEPSTS